MKPQELRMTRLEYQRFPKDVFRNTSIRRSGVSLKLPIGWSQKMKKQEQKDKMKAKKLREAEIARLENSNRAYLE